jgi:hypothetical protein
MINPNSNAMFSFSSILSPANPEFGLLGPLTQRSDALYPANQFQAYNDSFLGYSSPQSYSLSESEVDSESSSPSPLFKREETPSPSSDSSSSPSSSSSFSPVPPEPLVKTESSSSSSVPPESRVKVEKKPKKEKKVAKKPKSSLKPTELKTAKAAKKIIKETSVKELVALPITEIHKLDEDVRKEVKKERRKLQNRIAAQTSRIRKKQVMAELADENTRLKEENAKLVQINQRILCEKEKGDERVAELEARLAAAH